jgi:hypothetical protein
MLHPQTLLCSYPQIKSLLFQFLDIRHWITAHGYPTLMPFCLIQNIIKMITPLPLCLEILVHVHRICKAYLTYRTHKQRSLVNMAGFFFFFLQKGKYIEGIRSNKCQSVMPKALPKKLIFTACHPILKSMFLSVILRGFYVFKSLLYC